MCASSLTQWSPADSLNSLPPLMNVFWLPPPIMMNGLGLPPTVSSLLRQMIPSRERPLLFIRRCGLIRR
ncbi:uncharacterized protein LACBIDRAFT_298672 [Laccaria bicolor S238N-H82]|uniref:Predicted protein n=1 Tax=Laccaria bicolor (strain S238N-H82 / ATCC MYA-4686) TaxID=486041 RepID=B0DDD6_LACBS|nr:uncharacterized protein LACBIDRAFT_298672 [Laccaria bicolor S238N-H82]EDR07457.1 predicted protein [Laccaria bicolor S238N-H82]|eukprot:XP_001881849.1 predicted protein [Laccaria bicolor S238N-H82]